MKIRYVVLTARLSILLLVLGLAASPACTRTDYRVLAVREGIQGFSFEYPPSYKLTRLDLCNDAASQYTEVGLSAGGSGVPSEVTVYLWRASAAYTSASQVLDKLLENASAMLADYRLLERAPVVLGDTIAQQAVFSVVRQSETAATATAASPPPTVLYLVSCFLYGGLTVEVDMSCAPDAQAEAQATYAHILDTFKVID